MSTSPRRFGLAPLAALLAVSLIAAGSVAVAQVEEPFDEATALIEDERNTVDVIGRAGGSVVAVTVMVSGQVMPPMAGLPDGPSQEDDDRFREFFGEGGPVQASSGSGFLIDYRDDRFLVTNFHVVEGALEPGSSDLLDGAEVSVTFPSDSELGVTVDIVGVNPSFDLALLQARDASELPDVQPLAIADSDALAVGQKTIAIGNPFGLASTVTTGIVSAVERFVPTIGRVPVPMVQTDAAINPGNSGGPLLDSRGRLIGINTALINPQGRSFAGLGFAVPSNLLLESLANLELGGVTDVSDTRPRLGIAAQPMGAVPFSIRERLALPEAGVVVIDVQPGSVADRAGLRGSDETTVTDSGFEFPLPGDVIVAIDGSAIDSVEDVTVKVTFESEAGDELTFRVLRDGEEIDVPIRLEISGSNAFDDETS